MNDALEPIQQVLELLAFLRATLTQHLNCVDGNRECSRLALALRRVFVFTSAVATTATVELRWDFPIFA